MGLAGETGRRLPGAVLTGPGGSSPPWCGEVCAWGNYVLARVLFSLTLSGFALRSAGAVLAGPGGSSPP